MSKHVMSLHKDVGALQTQFNKLKLIGLAGAATGGLGFLGLGIIKETLKPAKEYAHQLAELNTLGMSQAEIAKTVGVAWSTAHDVMTTTATENLAAFRELRSAFGAGQEAHALGILPLVQRAKAILTSLTGKEQEHVAFDMVKAIELRSPVMTERALQRNATLMTQSLIGMGGTLTVSDFHQTLKYAKSAAMKWSDEFVYQYLPTLMQEVKAGKGGTASAGTALRTLDKAVHGRIQKAAYENWITSGLISRDDVISNATGH